jgi:hypothetical protein
MTSPAKTWEKVEKDVERLGRDVRKHFADVNSQTTEERQALEQSVRALLTAVEDGVTATGKALRDPKLCQDVSKIATSMRDALRVTFESAGVQVRERVGRPASPEKPKHGGSVKAAGTTRTSPKRTRAGVETKSTHAATTPRKRAAS